MKKTDLTPEWRLAELYRKIPARTILFIMAFALFPQMLKSEEKKPNILFIVSDDQGWGDLPENWDKTEVKMPVLDGLAKSGVRFSNYHTEPLCGPSRACMFTGQYSMENGMWRGPGKTAVPGDKGYRGIKRDVKMLSEHLSESGYATGAFGKWHMGGVKGELPNDRGFDEWRGFLSGAHSYWIQKKKSNIVHNGKKDESEGHATDLFTQWAEGFIRKNASKNKPFFCYLAYNAVHGPLRIDKSKPASAPKEWVDKALKRGVSFLRSDYVAILEHMDHNIGKLVKLLDELGIKENTLIVFVSDNGGCTMHGTKKGKFPGNNGPFRGSKATTYQGGLNVPFLMNWKGKLPSGMVSDDHVMHCDVFATLLDAAGIPVPKTSGKNPVRGMSLMSHMLSSGKESIPERTMIFELWGNIGLRKGNYKLWAEIKSNKADWKEHVTELKQTDLELFDLSKDIGEKSDLRTEQPEVYASLKKELIEYFDNINDEYPIPEGASPGDKEKEVKKVTKKDDSAASKRDAQFSRRDKNKDGKLSYKEFIVKPERGTEKTKQTFERRDTNKDGSLTLEEYK